MTNNIYGISKKNNHLLKTLIENNKNIAYDLINRYHKSETPNYFITLKTFTNNFSHYKFDWIEGGFMNILDLTTGRILMGEVTFDIPIVEEAEQYRRILTKKSDERVVIIFLLHSPNTYVSNPIANYDICVINSQSIKQLQNYLDNPYKTVTNTSSYYKVNSESENREREKRKKEEEEKSRKITEQKIKRTINTDKDILKSGEFLSVNEYLISANKKYSLVFQEDGNLVLYDCQSSKAIWASGTNGRKPQSAVMQQDGNFVIYFDGSNPWASNTANRPISHLKLEDNGTLVLYQNNYPLKIIN